MIKICEAGTRGGWAGLVAEKKIKRSGFRLYFLQVIDAV
jgi:hypothetical protein